ncbi:hypothetical protein SDC49_18475 [Lactobacillus sp. R2/2]|nr:hypothetical protein [Lactobacillus sp. R2/2]
MSIKLSQQFAEQLITSFESSPKDELLSLANEFCKLSQEQAEAYPTSYFFNSSLQNFYQHANHDFQFYDQVMRLVHQINSGGVTDQQFFTQIWAFIQGYSLLIINRVAEYEPF